MALRNATWELVERHSIAVAYSKRSVLPRIKVTSSGSLGQMLRRVQRYRLQAFLCAVPNEFSIPTAMAVLVDSTGEGPALTCGAASKPTYAEAAVKALLEACQSRSDRRTWVLGSRPSWVRDAKEVRTPTDRVLYWYEKDHLDEIVPWLSEGPVVDL